MSFQGREAGRAGIILPMVSFLLLHLHVEDETKALANW